MASTTLSAQTVTESTVYSFQGTADSEKPAAALIQAGDANLYGTTQGDYFTNYGSVFRVTPGGALTQIYAFSGGSDSATPFGNLIQGSDGELYGTTYGNLLAGTDGSVFKVSSSGTTVDTFYTFTGDVNGGLPESSLVLGSDGNYYGGTTSGGSGNGTLFQLTPSGTLTTMVTFTGVTGAIPSGPPVEFTDGNFYGTTSSGGIYGFGVFYKLTLSGNYTVLYNFSGTGDGAEPTGNPVVGSDGNFYGATAADGAISTLDTNGTVYKMTPSGAITTLHVFDSSTDGANPSGLFLASDGNLYGATAGGGTQGDGTLFEITPSGTFTVLYNLGSSPDDGIAPQAGLIQASDGNFYGTTLGGGTNALGSIFKLNLSPALAPPVQVTPSNNTISLGSSVTLNWQVSNAFSTTMQSCFASVQTTGTLAGSGSWTGLQRGIYSASTHIYSGSTTITPTAPATYTYGLTCGGIESGTGTVTVGGAVALQLPTSSLPQASVGVAYAASLVASGGVPPYAWSVTVGALPAGLALNASTGAISGKPAAAGVTNFTVQVKDSDSTSATAAASLSIAVVQPLVITSTSLPAVRVGSAYSQTLTATGGTPPYTWKQVSGTLPAGLKLAADGLVSGTPTAVGTATFTVSVSDSALLSQTALGRLSLVTEPLIVSTGVVSLTPAAITIGQTTAVSLNISAPAGSPAATGTVQFQANGVNVGTSVSVVNSSASLVSPAFNATGAYEITANYSGDPNYMALNFPPTPLAVGTAPVMAIQVTPSVLRAPAGGVTLTSIAVYNAGSSAVTFACSGLPANAVCNFGVLSSSGTATLQIEAYTAANMVRPSLYGRSKAVNLAWLLPGVLVLGAFTRGRRRIVLSVIPAIWLAVTTMLIGCSGGSPAVMDSPTGTNSVLVTATAGSQKASTVITLTVQ